MYRLAKVLSQRAQHSPGTQKYLVATILPPRDGVTALAALTRQEAEGARERGRLEASPLFRVPFRAVVPYPGTHSARTSALCPVF